MRQQTGDEHALARLLDVKVAPLVDDIATPPAELLPLGLGALEERALLLAKNDLGQVRRDLAVDASARGVSVSGGQTVQSKERPYFGSWSHAIVLGHPRLMPSGMMVLSSL